MDSDAQLIKLALKLERHPTCGYVSETYRSRDLVPQQALPAGFDGARAFGSVLYFMVTTDTQIAMHRIRSDQMYHHYRGDPLEVLLLYPDGRGEVRVVGSDIGAGMRPQLLIPGGTFHMSRLRAHVGYALLGTTEWPAVEAPNDVETAERDRLIAAFPAMAADIRSFMVDT
jgi:uncharacterized protein